MIICSKTSALVQLSATFWSTAWPGLGMCLLLLLQDENWTPNIRINPRLQKSHRKDKLVLQWCKVTLGQWETCVCPLMHDK